MHLPKNRSLWWWGGGCWAYGGIWYKFQQWKVSLDKPPKLLELKGKKIYDEPSKILENIINDIMRAKGMSPTPKKRLLREDLSIDIGFIE